jgi:hypothetical protein
VDGQPALDEFTVDERSRLESDELVQFDEFSSVMNDSGIGVEVEHTCIAWSG